MNDGLERLPVTTDHDTLASILRRDGALVIEGLIDVDTALRIDAELEPYVTRRAPGFNGAHDVGFYGPATKRIQGIAAKSPTFVNSVLLHSSLLGLADRLLRKYCGDYWMSQAETIYIGPGESAQELHRDDLNWSHAAELGIDLQISVLTALGDYDAEVGATMVVPGSHTWPLDQPIDPALARPVELEVGSAVVYLGSVAHGGGRNSTTDRWRKGLYCSYLLGWLTPEEATAMSLTPETAAALPLRARELLGWSSQRGTPTVDGTDAALQLWQLDDEDLDRFDGLFTHH